MRFLALLLLASGPLHAAEPVVIAHRGASGYLPEHTRESKVMAHAMGADYIEQDVVLSSDDVPMVLHDVHLDTTTDVAQKFPGRRRADGRFYAIDLTAAEIGTLVATERFDPRTGVQVMPGRYPKGRGVFRVPTLESELELIADLNRSTGRRAGIYPELKAPAWHRKQGKDLAGIVLPILRKHGYATKSDPCYVQCFEYAEVKRVREELGWKGGLIMLLGGTKGADGTDFTRLKTTEGLKELAGLVDGIGPSLTDVIKPGGVTDLVARAHAAGLKVHPYTLRADALPKGVKDVREAVELVFSHARADGLFTDHPDKVLSAMR